MTIEEAKAFVELLDELIQAKIDDYDDNKYGYSRMSPSPLNKIMDEMRTLLISNSPII